MVSKRVDPTKWTRFRIASLYSKAKKTIGASECVRTAYKVAYDIVKWRWKGRRKEEFHLESIK